MKTPRRKLMATAVFGLVLFSYSLPVWAGTVNRPEVQIGTNSASGSVAGARYSADGRQYIGCVFSATNGLFAGCSAMDKTGKSLGCTSTNPAFVAAVKGITDFSFITFQVFAGGSSCSSLQVKNFSDHLR